MGSQMLSVIVVIFVAGSMDFVAVLLKALALVLVSVVLYFLPLRVQNMFY